MVRMRFCCINIEYLSVFLRVFVIGKVLYGFIKEYKAMKVGEEINLKRLQDLSQECNAMRPMKVLFLIEIAQ